MKIAVTGITGHTGNFFCDELCSQKFSDTIRCLVREGSNTNKLDNLGICVEKVVGDRTNEDDLRRLLKGVDRCLHIANIHQSPLIIKIALEEHVKRVVLVHTTGIYSKHKVASQEYKKIEKQIANMIDGKDIDITILRPTMIFGDLCDHNIHKFIHMIDKLPFMPEINHGDGLIQPVNSRDLGKAYYRAIMAQKLPCQEYILSGDRPISMHELFEMIAKELNKTVHYISVPLWAGVFLAKGLKIITFGKVDYIEKVQRMGENRVFSHEKARCHLEYIPEKIEDGISREVNQYIKRRGIS